MFDFIIKGATNPLFALGNKDMAAMFDITNEYSGYLFLSQMNPPQQTIDQFEEATSVGLAMKYDNSQILISTKVGTLPWYDCSFDPYKSIVDIKYIKNISKTDPFMFVIILVESMTGTILGFKLMTPEINFCNRFVSTIHNRVNRGFIPYDDTCKSLTKLYKKYPTAADLADKADIICWNNVCAQS